MPSSADKNVSSSGPEERSGWFTLAAIERIAACVTSDLAASQQNASFIINRYFSTRDQLGGFGLGYDDFAAFLADWYAGPVRFYYFAGFLELATCVGYVDLGAWPDLLRFHEALLDFEKRESSKFVATDLVLVRDLLKRLDKFQYRASSIDEDGFHAFGSYLHLTSAIYRDPRFRSFISSTTTWDARINDDLSFLISPRHFAEALATGSISGFPASALNDGLVCLNYFRWFTEILGRLPPESATWDKFVRHARWSRHIEGVRARIDIWGDRMSEWDAIASVSERERAAAALERDALLPAASDFKRLDFPRYPPISRAWLAEGDPPVGAVLLSEAEVLLRQGRRGAAKKLLRKAARDFDFALHREFDQARKRIVDAEGPLDPQTASSMSEICKRLSDVGGVDAAAVLIAKYVDVFTAQFGLDDPLTKTAMSLIARACDPAASPATVSTSDTMQEMSSNVAQAAPPDEYLPIEPKPFREDEAGF